VALNPRGAFNLDLSLFGSRVTDIQATDLPPGVSPNEQNNWFLPGLVATRPAYSRALTVAVPNAPNILSGTEYAALTGDKPTVFIDSNGAVWMNDPESPSTNTLIDSVVAGLTAKWENFGGKLFGALYSPAISSAVTSSPFAGAGYPIYYNGTQIGRVTTDAPGQAPNFANLPTVAVALAGIGSGGATSETVTAASVSDPIPVYNGPGRGVTVYYQQINYTTGSTPPGSWVGLPVTVTGMTGTYADFFNTSGTVLSVGGGGFSISTYTSVNASATGQSGTASVPGSGSQAYFSRKGNVVTAWIGGASLPANFAPGFWASVLNGDNSLIKGPNWTITSITRDTTGLVTVVIGSQLTNLPPGAQLYIAATDATDFPAGFQTVYQVIATTATSTTFTFQSSDTTAATSGTGGSVYQQWSPQLGTLGNAAQIIASGVDPTNGAYFQFWQLGPDTSLGAGQGNVSSPQAQIQGQVPAGVRNAVLIFQSEDGAQTAPSQMVQVSVLGGTNLLQANNVAIGPPGTAQRILAFTPYLGSNWYYLEPATVPNISGLGQAIALGTAILDNVTTSAIIDFSDTQLTAGVQIDVDGNNLFNQIVLPPCLGVKSYANRLHWWGALNTVNNFTNLGFDGGYIAPQGSVSVTNGNTVVSWASGSLFIGSHFWDGQPITINGTVYTIASVTSSTSLTLTSNFTGTTGIYSYIVLSESGDAAPGWLQSGTCGLTASIAAKNGFAFKMEYPSQISQNAYEDNFDAPILEPNTLYGVRFMANYAGTGNAQIKFQLSSASTGFLTIATANVTGQTASWYYAVFAAATPATIPADLTFSIVNGNGLSSAITLDEVEVLFADQPVLSNLTWSSYIDNPFGYDDITGQLGVEQTHAISAAFTQRGYLYLLTDGPIYQSQNNGQTEPSGWAVTNYSSACDCAGPNAVDGNEDVIWWAGRYGARIFNGDPHIRKISQEVAPDWENSNWDYRTLMWVRNDPVQRLVYFGIVETGQTSVSALLPMSYRLNDDAYNVPDPVHTSTYTGRMIATDLGRKWSYWKPGFNMAAMCTRPTANGLAKVMVFCGGFGELYTQDFVNFPGIRDTDDDFGAISSWYQPYFFPAHDVEQNPIMGSYRKFFDFFSIHVTGKGKLSVTPYIDSLNNPWPAFPAFNLTGTDPGFDYQIPLQARGDRMSPKISVQSLASGTGGAYVISHMIFSAKQDMQFPVRGTIL